MNGRGGAYAHNQRGRAWAPRPQVTGANDTPLGAPPRMSPYTSDVSASTSPPPPVDPKTKAAAPAPPPAPQEQKPKETPAATTDAKAETKKSKKRKAEVLDEDTAAAALVEEVRTTLNSCCIS